MRTGKEIKAFVKANYGFVPDDCWIAHAKLARRRSDGTIDESADIGTKSKPCAEHKRMALFKAMRDLGVLD